LSQTQKHTGGDENSMMMAPGLPVVLSG